MVGVTTRQAQPSDFPFILNSWLKSFRDSSRFSEDIPKSVFFKFHHDIVEKILSRPTTTCVIATPKDEPDVILGYATFEKVEPIEVMHYIYVKRGFSGFGICKCLIDSSPFPIKEGVSASHMTYKGEKLIHKYNLTYNPYLIS